MTRNMSYYDIDAYSITDKYKVTRIILGKNLSLNGFEELLKTIKKCPRCGSDEGFWLAFKLYGKFLQCKHCGALIEVYEETVKHEEKDENRKADIVREK